MPSNEYGTLQLLNASMGGSAKYVKKARSKKKTKARVSKAKGRRKTKARTSRSTSIVKTATSIGVMRTQASKIGTSGGIPSTKAKSRRRMAKRKVGPTSKKRKRKTMDLPPRTRRRVPSYMW